MNSDDQSGAVDDVTSKVRDDLFALIGAADLPEDEKAKLLEEMMNLIQDRVLARIVEEVNDEDRGELEKILDGDDSDELDRFFAEKVPNFEQMFLEDAEKLRQELIIKFSE